jgi:PIN domain nuclease of toxin-antitoxin system
MLLDTHIFLWASGKDEKLRAGLRAELQGGAHDIFVSAASAWEIAIKHASGRLAFPVRKWQEMLTNLGFAELPITPAHGLEAGALPRHHLDPFDRMLVAQARIEGLALVTEDRVLHHYDVTIFCLPA